jgi:release factor glutamine methyltransferase
MDYEKIAIETAEDVYEPSEDSELASEMISDYLSEIEENKDKLNVLDLGTATGILGIFAAANMKAGKVTFADINPKAVKLAEINARGNRGSEDVELSFVETDLFSKIHSDKYDLMIFNAPYLRSEENRKMDDRRWSGGKEGVELSIRFLESSVLHLKKDGRIILVLSSLSNIELLKENMDRLGLKTFKELKKHYFFEDILVWLLGL